MTTATTEGRRLVLSIEGVDEPFRVDPLSARRGKWLTERFLEAAVGRTTAAVAEAVFIESFGPANYSRMTGAYVDEFTDAGIYVTTWNPTGSDERHDLEREAPAADADPLTIARFIARDPIAPELPLDGEAIRQEECEALCLCAFYWQTVVGMEAVTVFLESGEGTDGSLKALGLLQIRLGLSVNRSSSSPVMERLIAQQASSSPTPGTGNSSATVRLPASKRGFMQNPLKRPAKANRR